MRAVLRRAAPALAGDVARFADLSLDRQQFRVKRGKRDIHLGPTEFRLLDTLMQRPGRVFSREQLLDRVWGQDVYVEIRTVDVHIGRLRKALNRRGDKRPDPHRPLLGLRPRRDLHRLTPSTGILLIRLTRSTASPRVVHDRHPRWGGTDGDDLWNRGRRLSRRHAGRGHDLRLRRQRHPRGTRRQRHARRRDRSDTLDGGSGSDAWSASTSAIPGTTKRSATLSALRTPCGMTGPWRPGRDARRRGLPRRGRTEYRHAGRHRQSLVRGRRRLRGRNRRATSCAAGAAGHAAGPRRQRHPVGAGRQRPDRGWGG